MGAELIVTPLQVHDVLPDKILVSRESARELEQTMAGALKAASKNGPRGTSLELTLDFAGVEGFAPSFVDELITIFESIVSSSSARAGRTITILNPPTRLSSKFEAIARGHQLEIAAIHDGSWVMRGSASPA